VNGILGDDYWEPRTDIEMIRSLLTQSEHDHLDFKSTIDLASKEGKVKFVKDIVSLANTHPGGHLLIGVSDDGTICGLPEDSDEARFDSAKLKDIVSAYIEAPISIRSQVHNIDERKVVIIAVTPSRDMLPIVMAKQGEYSPSDKGKSTTVFKRGEVFLREGSQNVSLKHAHWPTLLEEHDEQIRKHTRASITKVIEELASHISRASGAQTTVPLSFELPLENLPEVLRIHLAAGDIAGLRMFATQALNRSITANKDSLIISSLIATQALFGDNQELVYYILDELYRIYCDSRVDTAFRLQIVVHLYVIASLAIRINKMDIIRSLVLKPYPPDKSFPTCRSWIRAGQADASDMNYFSDDQSGLVIDLSRAFLTNHPELRPDIEDDLSDNPVSTVDPMLDSLCQFDFLQVLLQQLPSAGNGVPGYPACAAYPVDRSIPLMKRLVMDLNLRNLFSIDDTDDDFKVAFDEAYDLAVQASNRYHTFWPSRLHALSEWKD